MRKSFLKAAIPTMAMLLVAVMALTGTTYAWFTTTQTARVDQIKVQVTAAYGMKVTVAKSSTELDEWANTLSLSTIKGSYGAAWVGTSTDLIQDFDAISTDGAVTNGALKFYKGTLDTNTSSRLSTITDNATGYIKFDVYVWNDSNESRTMDLRTTEIADVSDADKDATSAVRLALIKQTEAEKAVFTTPSTASYTGTAKIWSDDDTQTVYGLNTVLAYTTEAASQVAVSTAKNGSQVSYGAQQVTKTDFADDYWNNTIAANSVAKFTVYIWLEGQDPDCVNTITSGQFTVDIVFNMEDQE